MIEQEQELGQHRLTYEEQAAEIIRLKAEIVDLKGEKNPPNDWHLKLSSCRFIFRI